MTTPEPTPRTHTAHSVAAQLGAEVAHGMRQSTVDSIIAQLPTIEAEAKAQLADEMGWTEAAALPAAEQDDPHEHRFDSLIAVAGLEGINARCACGLTALVRLPAAQPAAAALDMERLIDAVTLTPRRFEDDDGVYGRRLAATYQQEGEK